MDSIDICKVTTFIENNLKSEYSLVSIADYIGYSPYYFSRAFRAEVGVTVMAYIRNKKLFAAADEIANGRNILEVALDYGFETHAGFTKAFYNVFGCTPKQYRNHKNIAKYYEREMMKVQNIIVRPIREADVNDLWENVYSAMTPNEIINIKILPSIEGYRKKEKIHLVAEVDGVVIGTLFLWRFNEYHPFGHLFDEVVNPNYDFIQVMEKLLEGMNEYAKLIGINTFEYYNNEASKKCEIFQALGFKKVLNSGGNSYHMMSI